MYSGLHIKAGMKVQATELAKLILLLKFPTVHFRMGERALNFSVAIFVPTKILSTYIHRCFSNMIAIFKSRIGIDGYSQ